MTLYDKKWNPALLPALRKRYRMGFGATHAARCLCGPWVKQPRLGEIRVLWVNIYLLRNGKLIVSHRVESRDGKKRGCGQQADLIFTDGLTGQDFRAFCGKYGLDPDEFKKVLMPVPELIQSLWQAR